MSSQIPFQQLRLAFTDPIQHQYEVIRPVVLFAETISERSRQTDIDRTVIGEKARRFLEEGMFGLVDRRTTRSGRKGHQYPEPIGAFILYLKQLYPPIHYREIVRIIRYRYGYHTNHHTVKHFLETHAIQLQMELDIPAFHEFDDGYQARYTVVAMNAAGWNKKSIAGLLQLSRSHVHQIIADFEREGFAGLEDRRTRPLNHPANQLTLPLLKEVLEIQQAHPRAGRFRVWGLLSESETDRPSEATVGRAMALNRLFHDAPGPWRSTAQETVDDAAIKSMPYRPEYRHQVWFIDIRYLTKLDFGWTYSICLIEGYSRQILAGMASAHQDLVAVLQILRAALAEYGCPDAIVSDSGAVFRAHDYERILNGLAIYPKQIAKGQPWQNLIEAQFRIQSRLADHNFEQATTLEEVQDHHAEFVDIFNTTAHWAHRARLDGRRTPLEVLDWVRGRPVAPAQLEQLFRHMQFTRSVNQHGFVSVQRFYIYAERGLSRQRVSVWLYEGRLYIEYRQNQLATYTYTYHRQAKRLKSVSNPTLYDTEYRSPQLEMLELDHEQWLKVRSRPYYRRPKRPLPGVTQLALSQLAAWALLVWRFFFPHV